MRDGGIPEFPIFVDSPLATRASRVFEQHADEIEHGDILRRALNASHIRFTETVEQSKAINRLIEAALPLRRYIDHSHR